MRRQARQEVSPRRAPTWLPTPGAYPSHGATCSPQPDAALYCRAIFGPRRQQRRACTDSCKTGAHIPPAVAVRRCNKISPRAPPALISPPAHLPQRDVGGRVVFRRVGAEHNVPRPCAVLYEAIVHHAVIGVCGAGGGGRGRAGQERRGSGVSRAGEGGPHVKPSSSGLAAGGPANSAGAGGCQVPRAGPLPGARGSQPEGRKGAGAGASSCASAHPGSRPRPARRRATRCRGTASCTACGSAAGGVRVQHCGGGPVAPLFYFAFLRSLRRGAPLLPPSVGPCAALPGGWPSPAEENVKGPGQAPREAHRARAAPPACAAAAALHPQVRAAPSTRPHLQLREGARHGAPHPARGQPAGRVRVPQAVPRDVQVLQPRECALRAPAVWQNACAARAGGGRRVFRSRNSVSYAG